DDVVVVLLPDSGFRYLSKTYNDEWMRRHGFLDEPARPALTVEKILARSAREGGVVDVALTDTLGEAIALMVRHGISQVPVMEDGKSVGSLTEKRVLSLLIEDAEAAGREVQEVMDEPLPVVSAHASVEELSAHLDRPPGAVLVHGPDRYDILHRSPR